MKVLNMFGYPQNWHTCFQLNHGCRKNLPQKISQGMENLCLGQFGNSSLGSNEKNFSVNFECQKSHKQNNIKL